MTETILAAQIEVGEHHTATWLGMTVNTDTVLSTAIAGLIVIALAFYLRAKVTSTDVPGGVQLFFEAITIQMRNQVESAIGMRIAPFVLPLAVTIFVFILISNWLAVLPVQYTDKHGHTTELLKIGSSGHQLRAGAGAFRVRLLPHGRYLAARYCRTPDQVAERARDAPRADQPCRSRQANLVVAPTFRQHFRRRHSGRTDRALSPLHHVGAQCIWKAFDLFVGAIQAFIFALLTILYFSQAMELEEEHH